MYFPYGEKETAYLKRRDKKLAAVIDKLGFIERETDSDLFAAVIRHIAGQQVSNAAQATIWGRLTAALGTITPEHILAAAPETLRSAGLSGRKAMYLKSCADAVLNKGFPLVKLDSMTDEEAITALTTLDGIGRWTAEMLLLFSLERKDILSYGDLGIRRGLRMLYQHKEITPALFAKYKKRYSPYGSIAAFYLWAVAGGALSGFTDPARKAAEEAALYKYYWEIPASPLGTITMTSDGRSLTALWFKEGEEGKKSFLKKSQHKELAVFRKAEKWLALYFSGRDPGFTLPVKLDGSPFQLAVWEILKRIPYGRLVTYGAVAKVVAQKLGKARMSAQAVGGAVGSNPVSIIVPCHRVIGAGGKLTGYGGGLWRKEKLLALEKADFSKLFVPDGKRVL